MILYIHGFNSAPASQKATLLREHLQRMGRGNEILIPALPHRPGAAMAMLEEVIGRNSGQTIKLVGSSLGGYYATWLAECHGFKAVLINPAVRPYDLLQAYLGPQQNLYTGETYEFTQIHLDELRALEVEALTRLERYLLLVQTGDEVLDYRDTVERYRGAEQVVIEGGDHGFRHFECYIDRILAF